MKSTPLLILLVTATLLSCHHRTESSGSGLSDMANVVVPLASTPLFYTQLKGKVGGKDITMQLLKTAPNLFRGYYRYDSTGQPVALWGTLDSGLVNIYEEANSDAGDRLFSGYLSDEGKFKGVWHGDGTSYHYELHTDLRKAVPLKVYYRTDSARLAPSHPGSPVGTFSASIIWPDSLADPAIAGFIIRQVTGGRFKDPHAYLKRVIDSAMLSYQVSGRDADTSQFSDPSASMSWNWTMDNDMKVVYNTWPLLVIETYAYDFTGGAHGNWGATYKTLDLAKKKVLTPEDIFEPGYREALSPLLDKAFKERYRLNNDESLDQHLLVKTIPPNDNIIVTDKGVSFSYMPYEIGPYALGQITLFVPFSSIKNRVKKITN